MGSGSGTGSPVPPVTLSLLFLLSEVLHRQPRAVYKFWAPCCAFSSSPRNWQSLIRCSLWFDSGYILRQSTAACGRCNSWTRCACTSLCNDRCRIVRTFLLWRRGSSPWSSSSCSRCSSRTRLLLCPLLVNDRCRSSAVAVFSVVDTPVFAQWLIPMVLTVEISQLQFDKAVFVPVVQVCSSIL